MVLPVTTLSTRERFIIVSRRQLLQPVYLLAGAICGTVGVLVCLCCIAALQRGRVSPPHNSVPAPVPSCRWPGRRRLRAERERSDDMINANLLFPCTCPLQ